MSTKFRMHYYPHQEPVTNERHTMNDIQILETTDTQEEVAGIIGPIESQADTIQRLRDENSALHKKIEHEQGLASEIRAAQAEEDELKERAKKAREYKDKLKDALERLVSGDVQTELGEMLDGEKQAQIKWDSPEEVADKRINNDAITLQPGTITWQQVTLSALSQLHSLGKPPKVKPVEIFGNKFIATDVTANNAGKRIVTMHQLYDADQFAAHYKGLAALELPNSDRTGEHDAKGALFACPVKIGRKLNWIGSDEDSLLVQMHDEDQLGGEVSADDEDNFGESKPIDYGYIATRIKSEIGANTDTAESIAAAIGIAVEVVIEAAQQSLLLSCAIDCDDYVISAI